MKIIDLFCGMGGWSTGFKQAGLPVTLGIDKWDKAIELYTLNGHNGIVGDVMELDYDDPIFDGVDLILASPPCQTFSKLNLNWRTNDTELTEKVLELVKGRNFIMENVPAVLLHVKYDPSYNTHLINMHEWRVPQTRVRAIVTNLDIFKNHHPEYVDISEYINKFSEIEINWLPRHSEGVLEVMKKVQAGEPTNWGKHYKTPETGVMPTIVNVMSNYTQHPTETRRLSIKETAILQTFPADYRIPIAQRDSFKMVANAVPPIFAQIVAEKFWRYYRSCWDCKIIPT